MKKIVVLLILTMLFVGCGGKENEGTIVCKRDSGASQIKEEVTIEKDNENKPTKIIVTKEAALADYLFEDHSIEELEELYKNTYIHPKREQKGLSFDIKVDPKEKKLSVVIEIDPELVSELDMRDLELKEYKDAKKQVSALESEGYSCKETK